MSNIEIKKAIQPLQPQSVGQFTPDQLELIKSTVARGATNDELSLFLYRCKNLGLDPLKPGQVHFIKYGTAPGVVVMGVDGLRVRAMRTGYHRGTKRGVLRDENGKCVGGWAEVFRKDWEHPARVEVSLAEYHSGRSNWSKMPETMIQKVAEAQALRMAFPDELGDLHTMEEMEQPEKSVKVRELEAKIAETPAEPVFEEGGHFESVPEAPVKPDGLGAYVLRVGLNKGKRLDEVPAAKLEGLVQWYHERKELGHKHHDEVTQDVEAVEDFLAQHLATEINNADSNEG